MACAPKRFLPNNILLVLVYLLDKNAARENVLKGMNDDQQNDQQCHSLYLISSGILSGLVEQILYRTGHNAAC
jgi:hypothetical protein